MPISKGRFLTKIILCWLVDRVFPHTTLRNSQLINELEKEFMNQTGQFFTSTAVILAACRMFNLSRS